MEIEQLIGNLILRYNCVIVPNFGGFVGKNVPAYFDFKNKLISPPKKTILFNKNLTSDDGLLVKFYAEKCNLSYENAFSSIQNLVSSWSLKLNGGERISIDNIGYIFMNKEGVIGFTQDETSNLFLNSYGLSQVSVTITTSESFVDKPIEPVKKAKIIQLEAEQKKETSIEDLQKNSTLNPKRNSWKYLAAACLFPFLFYVYWIPMHTNILESKMISFNDFNPFHQLNEELYKKKELTEEDVTLKKEDLVSLSDLVSSLPSDVEFFSYPFDADLYIPIRIQTLKLEKDNSVSEFKKSESNQAKFFLIAGCFANKSNAENLVKKLQGNNKEPKIIDNNKGLYRVSVAESDIMEELILFQEKMQLSGLSTWVLKK
jgi:hypothetical protein